MLIIITVRNRPVLRDCDTMNTTSSRYKSNYTLYFFIGCLLLGYEPVETQDLSYYFPIRMAKSSPWHKIGALLVFVELMNESVVRKTNNSPNLRCTTRV